MWFQRDEQEASTNYWGPEVRKGGQLTDCVVCVSASLRSVIMRSVRKVSDLWPGKRN